MTTYTYSQLEALWISQGGPKAVAPIAAAIALAESGGRSDAYNASGATGTWQILGLPSGMPPGTNLLNGKTNARAAVLKYKQAGNSFSPWQTYTQGTYKQFLRGNVPPGHVPGSGGAIPAQTTSISSSIIGGILSALGVPGKDFFIRAGLIALGGILLIAGIIMIGKKDNDSSTSIANVVPAGKGSSAAEGEAAEAAEVAPEAALAAV